jgi:hypothetical protein
MGVMIMAPAFTFDAILAASQTASKLLKSILDLFIATAFYEAVFILILVFNSNNLMHPPTFF